MKQRSLTRPQQHAIDLKLESMTYGGDALSRFEGKAIFVQSGIAGERVQAVVIEERKGFSRARAIDVIEPSADRVRPRCPHFGFEATACGGCHWQHIDYVAQVRFKTDIVREQFRRIGRIDDAPVHNTIPSPEAWAYRNHAQFSIAPGGRPGFQAARSNRSVAIDECHIVQAPIARWLQANRTARGDRVDVRVDAAGDAIAGDSRSPSPVSLKVKAASFRVSPGSFFQVNTSLIETLVDAALGALDARTGETILDAYCGVGLFARFIAPIAGRVIGIESSPGAIADARENLAAFGNIELRQGEVETEIPEIGQVDAAIVDPPRAGCGPQTIAGLIAAHPKRLVYVSCDPSTLARDARQLIDGGYRLVGVQPLDMFPQTYHIECVATFVK